MEDLKDSYGKNKHLFNNVKIDSLESDTASESNDSENANETFTADVKNAFNDPSSKHKFNNVTGNIGKQINDSLLLNNTVADTPTYKHRKADFDKKEYKPFT